MSAGNGIRVSVKNSKVSELLNHLSSPLPYMSFPLIPEMEDWLDQLVNTQIPSCLSSSPALRFQMPLCQHWEICMYLHM